MEAYFYISQCEVALSFSSYSLIGSKNFDCYGNVIYIGNKDGPFINDLRLSNQKRVGFRNLHPLLDIGIECSQHARFLRDLQSYRLDNLGLREVRYWDYGEHLSSSYCTPESLAEVNKSGDFKECLYNLGADFGKDTYCEISVQNEERTI